MIRARAIAALIAVSAVSTLVAILAPPAWAESPAQQGWWTSVNPGAVPGIGIGLPASPPLDVPSNGLLIEGGESASSPIAYAGLIYQVPLGAEVGALTLDVASESATTPNGTLELCPLVEPTLVPEQGGPMSAAPAYNCSKNVVGHPSSSGTSYEFNVSSLVADGLLGVAILPTSSTDRVVFDQPTTTSLAVSATGMTLPSSTAGSSGIGPSPGTSSVSPLGTVPQPLATFPSISGFAPVLPTTTTSPASALPPQGAKSSPPKAAQSSVPFYPATNAILGGGAVQPLTVALVIFGLIAAGMLWRSAGNRAMKQAVLRRAQ